ncbi:hypothetical protein H632_c2293p0, partial [Helicosporidium sp. ATCC 50920]
MACAARVGPETGPTDRAKLEEIFRLSDKNWDGALDEEEVAWLVQHTNPASNLTNEQIDLIVEEIWTSFAAWIEAQRGLTMDGLAQLYDQGLADIHRDHLILTNPAEQPETPESASAPTEETLQSMEQATPVLAPSTKNAPAEASSLSAHLALSAKRSSTEGGEGGEPGARAQEEDDSDLIPSATCPPDPAVLHAVTPLVPRHRAPGSVPSWERAERVSGEGNAGIIEKNAGIVENNAGIVENNAGIFEENADLEATPQADDPEEGDVFADLATPAPLTQLRVRQETHEGQKMALAAGRFSESAASLAAVPDA